MPLSLQVKDLASLTCRLCGVEEEPSFIFYIVLLIELKQQSSSVSLLLPQSFWKLPSAWMAKGMNCFHAEDGEFRKRATGKLISRVKSQGSRVDSWLVKPSMGCIPNETTFVKVALSHAFNVYLLRKCKTFFWWAIKNVALIIFSQSNFTNPLDTKRSSKNVSLHPTDPRLLHKIILGSQSLK